MKKQSIFQNFKILKNNILFIKFSSFCIGLLLVLTSSCSNIPAYMYIEPIQDLYSNENNKIDNQSDLVVFLENIINSGEIISIEAYGRRTLSHRIKQTKILTHSFYLINSNDGRYYTLSFSGANISFYSDGYWVLNKETDISSYRLFIEGNNIWDVIKLFPEYSIDAHQTLINIINVINLTSNYYFLDHFRKKLNHFNCNTAVTETIVINQEIRFNNFLTYY